MNPPTYVCKKITKENVEHFPRTKTFQEVRDFVTLLAKSVEGIARVGSDVNELTPAGLYAPFIVEMRKVFTVTRQWIAEIPLHDMKQQRYGNKAFRDFSDKLSANCSDLLFDVAKSVVQEPTPSFIGELCGYFLDSFGNAQRIDYGTGHELHFIAFILIALKRDRSVPPSSFSHADLRDIVLILFTDYMQFCRLVQSRYSLEPAGSHGVWGLDDYHHAPFIFGASQLVGHEDTILPKHITDHQKIAEHKNKYFYFEMIGWIFENKRGPFHEHSPTLYNVSGIDEWERIRRGMQKMYEAEVMSRFAVVQHFLFGVSLPLE